MQHTWEEITMELAERWCYPVAPRDDARVVRRLCRQELVVYPVEAGTARGTWDQLGSSVGGLAQAHLAVTTGGPGHLWAHVA